MAKRRGQLRVEEFITFYKMLTYRPELMHIIHTYFFLKKIQYLIKRLMIVYIF